MARSPDLSNALRLLMPLLWLCLWSMGASSLQSLLLFGGLQGVIIAVATVVVVTVWTRRHGPYPTIAANLSLKLAQRPGRLRYDASVDGVTYSWLAGSSGLASTGITALMAMAMGTIVALPLMLTLVEAHPLRLAAGALLAAVWVVYAGRLWVRTLQAHLHALGSVEIEATSTRLVLRRRTALGTEERSVPAWGAGILTEPIDDHVIVKVIAEGTQWTARAPAEMSEQVERVQAFCRVAADTRAGGTVPAAVRALRERPTDNAH